MIDGERSPNWFSKPGDSIRRLMQTRGMTGRHLAEVLGLEFTTVRGILDGSVPIDENVACVLAGAFGGSVQFWLKRQSNFDEALTRVAKAAETDATVWLERVPVPGLRPRGRLDAKRREDEVKRRLVFFNVASLRSWESRYGRLADSTRFRTSERFASTNEAVLLWLRQGELEAELAVTRPWSPEALQDRLGAIRKLSRLGKPSRFLPKLRVLFAEAGVALVTVKAPHGCRASGASRLVAPDKAMILVSFRYRADDQFWFTVFHEIGHLLLHEAKPFVDDGLAEDDESEREANDFASSCIVPANRMSEFNRLSGDLDSVIRFSVSIGVAPGLVVGQMQHRQMISHQKLNSLKRHWTWGDIDPVLASP